MKGFNFIAATKDEIHVTFGGYSCNVTTFTDKTIKCRMNSNQKPPMNVWLPVNIHIKGLGNGAIQIPKQRDYSVIFQHSVISYSPKEGSSLGGTDLTLSGFGLDVQSISVIIGVDEKCRIISQSYTELTCYTPPLKNISLTSGDENYALSVIDSSYGDWYQTHAHHHTTNEFTYRHSLTPVFNSIEPSSITLSNRSSIIISGSNFGTVQSDIEVTIGDKQAKILSLSNDSITSMVPSLPFGSYAIAVRVNNLGYAYQAIENKLVIEKHVSKVSPNKGSMYGNTEVSISGSGFFVGKTTVKIENSNCVIKNMTETNIVCFTERRGQFTEQSNTRLSIVSNNVAFSNQLTFDFTAAQSPVISSVSPEKGVGGDKLTLNGTFFSDVTKDDVTVRVGEVSCHVDSVTSSSITCLLDNHTAGVLAIRMTIKGYGDANIDKLFQYELRVASPASTLESGLGGGRHVNLSGRGFGVNISVKICDSLCEVYGSKTTDSTVTCLSPMYKNYENPPAADISCDIVVQQDKVIETLKAGYVYKSALTSKITDVTPRRSGTGGGVTVSITGENFATAGLGSDSVSVTIDGVECQVKTLTATQIDCITGASNRSAMGVHVKVQVKGGGLAIPENAKFDYIDVWSSKYSWGGKELPKQGEV